MNHYIPQFRVCGIVGISHDTRMTDPFTESEKVLFPCNEEELGG
jgi:hypothetical protein